MINKKIFLIIFIFILGCASMAEIRQTDMSSDQLAKCPGNKSGFLELENGDIITFKCAHVFVTRKMIRILSDRIHQTILWRNTRQIIIYNSCLYEEYRKAMKAIQTQQKN